MANLNLTLDDVIEQETVDLYTQQVIPISDRIVQSLEDPPQRMMSPVLTEAELQKASEIAAAGKAFWDAALQGAIDLFSGSGGMMSTPKDEGRRKPVKIENLRGAKPGWKMAEGTNWWSVDEKDPYWQTKRGYEEAINLYGTKPSWVKEPSLEYNPKTEKYDSTKKEEFVDLKPTKRISL